MVGFHGLLFRHRMLNNLTGHFRFEAFRKAEVAGLANTISHLVGDHVLINPVHDRFIGQVGFDHGFKSVIQDLAQEQGLELPAEFADLFNFGEASIPGHLLGGEAGGGHVAGDEGRYFH